MKKAEKIWMDGKLVDWKDAKIHVLSHSLHYGTAIFEGIRCYETKKGTAVFRLEDHLHRLADGMKIYHFTSCIPIEFIRRGVLEVIRANKLKTGYIRPLVYVGTEKIGLDVANECLNVAIIGIPYSEEYQKADNGLNCKISTWKRIESSIISPNVKASANYLNSALGKDEAARDGYDEAIFLNSAGKVAEASGENIFLVKNGKLLTPEMSDGILMGITRDTMIKIAEDAGIETIERHVLREELYTADEIFLTGSAAEIVPVKSVDKIIIGNGKMGSITKRLKQKYFDLIHGKNKKYTNWLTYVNKR